MRRNLGLLAFCISLLISGSSGAQDTSTRIATHCPDHSVQMVVGFTAGGPTDVIARIVAEKLSTSFGQRFYVDNRPGAGGNIASAEVAKAAPDGYTIICKHRLHGEYEPLRACALRRGQGLCADYDGR